MGSVGTSGRTQPTLMLIGRPRCCRRGAGDFSAKRDSRAQAFPGAHAPRAGRAGRSVRNLWRARAFLNAWRMGGVLFWRTANRINGDMPAAREAHH